MLDKLCKLFKLPKEYINELKITWIGDEVEILNYELLKDYSNSEIKFLTVIIRGSKLQLMYQDPYVVRIKGSINEDIKAYR